MPSYGGANIFGTAVSMRTADNPRATQVNSYFGLSGLETLDGGLRGRTTEASGLLYASTPQLLAACESNFRLNNDGIARTLIDNLGYVWPNVRLVVFQPQGRIRQSPSGVFFRAYRASFQHLE